MVPLLSIMQARRTDMEISVSALLIIFLVGLVIGLLLMASILSTRGY
jgi:hypothetical protein